MKIREITAFMMIVTGILIEKFGLKTANPHLEEYFGIGSITIGVISLIVNNVKSKNK